MAVRLVNGLPRSSEQKVHGSLNIEAARANNQFVIKGTDPVIGDEKSIIFLEYVATVTGTFTIEGITDSTGVLTGAIPSPYEQDNPLRIDGELKLNGDIAIARGFIVQT